MNIEKNVFLRFKQLATNFHSNFNIFYDISQYCIILLFTNFLLCQMYH